MNWIFGHSLLNLNFERVVKNSDLLLKLHLMRFPLKYKISQMSCGFDTNLAPSLVMPVSQKSCKCFEVFNIGGICNRTKMPLSVWALYSARLVRCVMFQIESCRSCSNVTWTATSVCFPVTWLHENPVRKGARLPSCQVGPIQDDLKSHPNSSL